MANLNCSLPVCMGLNVFLFESAVMIHCCKVLVFGRNDTSFVLHGQIFYWGGLLLCLMFLWQS